MHPFCHHGNLLFFSSEPSACCVSSLVSIATAETAWGCTLAGVWARLGRVLAGRGGVFLPVGVLEVGARGDSGRLLGAGEGGLFLDRGALRSRGEP